MKRKKEKYGTVGDYEKALAVAMNEYGMERGGYSHGEGDDFEILRASADDINLAYARFCVGMFQVFSPLPKSAAITIKQYPKLFSQGKKFVFEARYKIPEIETPVQKQMKKWGKDSYYIDKFVNGEHFPLDPPPPEYISHIHVDFDTGEITEIKRTPVKNN